MKANELMIGDWADFAPELGDQPIAKIITVNDLYMIDNGRMVVRPIPLTPEILEKNGFEDTMGDAFWISTSCNLLWKDGKLQNFCREEDDEVCIPCEYVHELQHALRLCKVDKEIVL